MKFLKSSWAVVVTAKEWIVGKLSGFSGPTKSKGRSAAMAAFLGLFIGLVGGLMQTATAATYTNAIGGYGAWPANGSTRSFLVKKSLNLSAVAVATGETVAVVFIPSNTVVEGVTWDVTTATTNAVVFDIGDNDVATQYFSLGIASNSTYPPQLGTRSILAAAGGTTNTIIQTISKLYTNNNALLYKSRSAGIPATGIINLTIFGRDISGPAP